MLLLIPQRYDFSSKSQLSLYTLVWNVVVVDTTKVRFFKQITTICKRFSNFFRLLLIPQRYDFSSKSQLMSVRDPNYTVVVDTTKVRFFKQITTLRYFICSEYGLLLIPQRYDFSSKSQQKLLMNPQIGGCC